MLSPSTGVSSPSRERSQICLNMRVLCPLRCGGCCCCCCGDFAPAPPGELFCSVLSCPAWRAALGRCCREGLGLCLHSRFSLSLSSACLFPDDVARGRHSDKFRASLACLNLTQECAPSLSPSPSPPWLCVSPQGDQSSMWLFWVRHCAWLHSMGKRL